MLPELYCLIFFVQKSTKKHYILIRIIMSCIVCEVISKHVTKWNCNVILAISNELILYIFPVHYNITIKLIMRIFLACIKNKAVTHDKLVIY